MADDITVQIQKALDENIGLRTELKDLRERVQLVEQENRHLRDRLSESEEEQFRFVNLYISCQRLAMSPDVREIIEILQEIVINLIGSEQFGIFVADSSHDGKMELITERGEGEIPLQRPPLNHPRIVGALESGSVYVADSVGVSPVAVIPLKIDTRVLGAIVIYGVLPQKPAFTPVDIELFEMLSGLAGRAIYAAALYPQMANAADWPELLRTQLVPEGFNS